jgi:hypothetical protein
MFRSTRGTSSASSLNLFVSKFVLFSCIVFAMAWFAEREPELPGAQQHARWSEYKITILYIYIHTYTRCWKKWWT